ncbi:hypothetical protein V070_01878 [Staphylococcus aureus C0673]|nr:hypothetical protein V070_01878 [Staphylococcus aureus C0673]
MRNNIKNVTSSILVASIIVMSSTPAFAASFGDRNSGASSVESFQIRYTGLHGIIQNLNINLLRLSMHVMEEH